MRPPDADVRSLAGEILERAEFARWRSLEADFFLAIGRWIEEYFSWVQHLRIDSPVLFWLYLAGLLALALALFGHIFLSMRAAFAVPVPPAAERKGLQPPDWVGEAERFAAQGRFLEGAHQLVLGSIQLLVGRGVIDLGRADANRILRDRVRGSALADPLRARFLRLLDAFEERWFRDRVEDDELFRAWRDLHAQLVGGVRGSG